MLNQEHFAPQGGEGLQLDANIGLLWNPVPNITVPLVVFCGLLYRKDFQLHFYYRAPNCILDSQVFLNSTTKLPAHLFMLYLG